MFTSYNVIFEPSQKVSFSDNVTVTSSYQANCYGWPFIFSWKSSVC